jgi:predicted metal-dependent enzyme (double-stranded beta helix superfamily)
MDCCLPRAGQAPHLPRTAQTRHKEEHMSQRLKGLILAAVVVGTAYASTVLATDPSGFTSTTLAKGRFDEIDVHNVNPPPDYWQAKLKTHGLSDLYVQSNVWAPGGTTGWHTHPGHSLITVTAGTVTAYEGDDPDCTPTVYTVGMGFVDHGGDHVHVLRNEGAVEARTITVQLIPADAMRRIDAPSPGNCPF